MNHSIKLRLLHTFKQNCTAKCTLALCILSIIILSALGVPTHTIQRDQISYAQILTIDNTTLVLQLTSASNSTEKVRIDFFSNEGVLIETVETSISPNNNKDILLNNVKSFAHLKNGLLKISSISKHISGKVSYYHKDFDSNISRTPLTTNARSFQISDSYTHYSFVKTPDVRSYENIIRITNLDTVEQYFDLAIYSKSGEVLERIRTKSVPYAQTVEHKFSTLNEKNVYGYIHIAPMNQNSPYISTLHQAIHEPFTLLAAQHFRSTQNRNYLSIPVSRSFPAYSKEIEKILLTNCDDTTQSFSLVTYGQSGTTLHEEQIILQSKETYEHPLHKAMTLNQNTSQIVISSSSSSYFAEYARIASPSKKQDNIFILNNPGIREKDIPNETNVGWDPSLSNSLTFNIYNTHDKPITAQLIFINEKRQTFTTPIYLPSFGSSKLDLSEIGQQKLLSYSGILKSNNNLYVESIKIKNKGIQNQIVGIENNYTPHTQEYDNRSPKNVDMSQTSTLLDTNTFGTKDITISNKEIRDLILAGNYFRVNGSVTSVKLTSIRTSEGEFSELIPHEIRSDKYTLLSNSKNTTRPSREFITFFKLANENSKKYARINIIESADGPRISGIIAINDERYVIRPHLMDLSGKTLMLFDTNKFKQQELTPMCNDKLINAAPIEKKEVFPSSGIKNTIFPSSQARFQLGSSHPRIIEVATEADYERFKFHGSEVSANNHFMSLLNEADGFYRNELGVEIRVVFQNVWTNENDPYTATYNHERLFELRKYWNENFLNKQNYDYVHLFTQTPYTYAAGTAFLGGVCTSPYSESTYSYGHSTMKSGWSRTYELSVLMHELGHSLGADHDECPTDQSMVMCPGGDESKRKFSQRSKDQIAGVIKDKTCLLHLGFNSPPNIKKVSNQNVKVPNKITIPLEITDPEGNYFSVESSGPGRLLPSNKEYYFDSATESIGKHYITIKATDEFGKLSQMIILITVERNPKPEITEIRELLSNGVHRGFISWPIKKELQLQITAQDPDQDTLSYSVKNLPQGASFANRVLKWMPEKKDVGKYQILFIVKDSFNEVSLPFNVTIQNVNEAPKIDIIEDKEVKAGHSLSFRVTAKDNDGDSIFIKQKTSLKNSTFESNIFTYSPKEEDVGAKQIVFTASDGYNPPTESSVIIRVRPSSYNNPPTLSSIEDKNGRINQKLTLTLQASDRDNDPLIFSANPMPQNASITGNIFQWTPKASDAGSRDITFTVRDPKNSSDSKKVRFNISSENLAWQNPSNQYDVNDDKRVTSIDALVVINRLNRTGAGPLKGTPNLSKGEAYYDVTGDNMLTSMDALNVINYLNRGGN